MAYARYMVPYYHEFFGNQDITISSINTSGGIAYSRTSGKTPCFVQVSASAMLSDAGIPYEDVFYTWNFGDPSSTETFDDKGTRGVGTRNSNSDQLGPEAAHCYRSDDTFTVTLTMYGYNSSGLIKRTVTQEIVVSAFVASGGEYWADSTAGGTNAGTEANPFNTVAAINTAISSGTNKAVHVKDGSAFDGSVSLTSGVTSGLRIDTYGTGAMPSFNVSSGTTNVNALRFTNGSTIDDVVISGIRFSTSGTSAAGNVVEANANFHASNTITNLYLDNCQCHVGADNNLVNCVSFNSTPKLISNFGLWNTVITGPASMTNRSTGYYYNGMRWAFFVGGSVEGGTSAGDLTHDHHIYPAIKEHELFRWVEFKTGENRNYCINMNYNALDDLVFEYSQYRLVADCHLKGVQRAHDGGNGGASPNDPSKTRFKNFVFERNKVSALTADAVFLFSCVETYTHRDNQVWGCSGGRYLAPDASVAQGAVLRLLAYRNKIHRDATVSAGDIISLPGSEFTQLHQITHNIIVDLRAISRMIAVAWTQQTGSIIDGNQYHAPSDGGANGWRDGTTEKTFAQWQAQGYDLNGSVADPGWTDPANGDFS